MTIKRVQLILLLFFSIVGELLAQPLFTRVYGGDSYDSGAEVIQTPDDGYLVAGTSGSFGLESGQIMLIKTDPNGYEEWRRYYGDEYAEQAESMELTADGNLIIAGTGEVVGSSYQYYAVKMTLDGDTLWTRSYGGTDWDFCKQVAVLPDGGFALFGQSYNSGNGDFHLVRINTDGDTLWTRSYGGPMLESGESISLASDGGFFLAGTTESFGAGGSDMYVVRTDEFGDTLWTRTFGGPENDVCYGIGASPDGGYVIVGGTFNNTAGVSDMITRKEGGTESWVKHELFGSNAVFTDVLVEAGIGTVTPVGYYESGDFGGEDGRILSYGPDGIWAGVAKTHGSEGDDRFYDVKRCSDGGYVMVGTTDGYLNRFDDVYLVRTDNLGFSVNPELGVNEIDLNGETFKVTVAPNPINRNSALVIENFEYLSKIFDANLSVSVQNTLGVEVGRIPVNSKSTQLQLENLAKGVYVYQLSTPKRVLATGKAIKL